MVICGQQSDISSFRSQRLRPNGQIHQAGGLIKPEHQIHILNRLARRAFHKIIFDRDDDGNISPLGSKTRNLDLI
jgi:hypothetical protein